MKPVVILGKKWQGVTREKSYSPSEWKNRLFPVASGQDKPEAISFHTDATIYRADFGAGYEIGYTADESRRVFIYVTDGNLTVNDVGLTSGDQARVEPEANSLLKLKADSPVSFVIIDVPAYRA